MTEFEDQWRQSRRQVLAYCVRAIGNPADAEDVFQRVAFRAWRGYSSFRGDSSFLTWVLSIARRETARALSRVDRYEPLDPNRDAKLDRVAAFSPPSQDANSPGWLCGAAAEAESAGALTQVEARVLLERLSYPDLNWESLGRRLGLAANNCAVTHCRAIPKLRVFLFVHRPDLLGGVGSISAAFAEALKSTANPLTPEESEVFRTVVLQQNRRYRRSELAVLLRYACGKVIRFLPVP